MDTYELSCAVEALLFAQAVPMDFAAIRAALRRAMPDPEAEEAAVEGAPDPGTAGGALNAAASVAARTVEAQNAASDVAAGEGASSEVSDAEPAAAQQEPERPGPVDPGVAALAAELAGAADAGTSEDAEASEHSGQQAQAGATQDAAAEAKAAEAATSEATPVADDAGADAHAPDVDDAPESISPTQGLPPLLLTSPVPKVPRPPSFGVQLQQAIALLQERWRDPSGRRGFALVEVAGGLTFRTNPRHAELLRAVRQPRAQRLSRAVLETLAIAAYRQPTTKPEIDQLRGVDSGGSLKVLLERRLLTVVGKKEEPGRPLLYGTTPDFLSHFNLSSVANLPSLREFHELADDDDAAGTGGLAGLADLARVNPNFRVDEAIGTDELEAAVAALQRTQGTTRAALLAQGVRLTDDEETGANTTTPEAPTHH